VNAWCIYKFLPQTSLKNLTLILSTFKSILLEITFEECGVMLLIYSYLFQLTVILENG
jgi:hypothetical protein